MKKPWKSIWSINPIPGVVFLWQELDATILLSVDDEWTVSGPREGMAKRPFLITESGFRHWEWAT